MRILPCDTPVTKKETMLFGIFGGAGITYSYILFSSVILYYFTDVLCISTAATGVLLLIARVWDGINDPLMGILIDKTHSPWGKNRPYILVGGILMSIFTVLLFTNPNFKTENARLAWAYFTYIGYGMSYTICTIAIASLPSRMTTNRSDITKLSSSFFLGSGIMSAIASLTIMTCITKLAGPNGDVARGYQLTATMAAIIVLLFTTILALSVKERNLEGAAPKKIKVFAAIKTMVTNIHYLGFMISQSVVLFGYYLSASTIMYYCIYNLGSQDFYTPLLFCDYAMPFIAAITLPYIAKRVDKKKVVWVALVIIGTAYLLRYLTGDTNIFVMVSLAALGGLALSYYNILFTPIALDCAIYSERKTGLQLQGSFAAASSVLGKCASGFAAACLAVILDRAGYVKNAAEQTAEVLNVLKLCAILSFAVASLVAAVVFILMYRLKDDFLEQANKENIEMRDLFDASGTSTD